MAELDGVFYKEIVEQALREFPNECCGVIAAEDGVPVKVFAMTNVDASAVTYRIDGKEQLDGRSTSSTTTAGTLWAIYHSHTHSEAYPSRRRDIAKLVAFYPDVRYLLLSRRATATTPCSARSSSATARSPKRS